jgi:hypothetical protein
VNILAGFADISLGQLVLVGGMALLASSSAAWPASSPCR